MRTASDRQCSSFDRWRFVALAAALLGLASAGGVASAQSVIPPTPPVAPPATPTEDPGRIGPLDASPLDDEASDEGAADEEPLGPDRPFPDDRPARQARPRTVPVRPGERLDETPPLEDEEALEVEGVTEDVVDTLGDAFGDLGGALPRVEPVGRLNWDPSWPRYRFDELVVTLGMGLVIGIEEALPTRSDTNWQGTTEFDLDTARAFGLNSASLRDGFEEASNGIVIGLLLWPTLVDSLLYAGLGEGSWDVAWQLSLISLEVFTINHALTVLVRLLGRRERPLGRFCREEPGYDADPICADQPPAQSFWSSHTSNAFASAAMMCLSHDVLDLYGDEGADGVACATGLAAAAATGLFRIMSDSEWVTDVISGAIVGTLSGLLIPWLLHYQGGARPPLSGSSSPTITFMPMVGDDVIGGMATGLW